MNAGLVSRSLRVWLAGLLGLAATHCATAQEPVVDPPGRVARLSLMDGEVSLAPAGTEEWADAVLNRPLTSGDKMWIGTDARAELQVGTATLHLDRSTGFEFIELDDDVMQMSLTEGGASIRVRTLGEHETVQVETPNATVHLLHPGEYSLQIDPESDRTIVRTRNGEAEVTGASKSFRVRAGEEGVFTGLDGLTASIGPLSQRTAFEAWANDRDRRSEQSESSRYVAREVIGYEDLDGQGEWIEEPEYGHVWRPLYVVHDWAPYRYGRWGWVSPWGWTWIDDARWGFAPFHYGRWAFVRHRWCWVPGPRHIRPYYAPALVGWVGGPSVGVSVSFGSGVGWFPLAPHEVYRPWYRHTPRYVRHVNVSNTIIVNNLHVTNINGRRGRQPNYRNRAVADAVTVAQRDAFVRGRPVGGQRLRVNDRELRQWRDNVRPTAITPERESVLAGQPRRAPPERRVASAGENPKRGGDFRSARQGVNAGQIKRAEGAQRARSPQDRVALTEQARSAQSPERLQTLRGGSRTDSRTQNSPRTRELPRARDHMERPPAQALQSSPSSGAREARESFERRDNVERPRPRPEQRVQRELREQPQREVREQPRAREWSQQQSQPRQTAPVERQLRAAPVERETHAAPVERQQPRAEARSHSERARDTSSSRQQDRGGEGPKASRHAQRPNSRPQQQ